MHHLLLLMLILISLFQDLQIREELKLEDNKDRHFK